jgi:Lrp/AsnC family transcriptional regulator for asnA, asnC and gidA
MNYDIDNLDRGILRILQKDARTPYSEIARELDVSGGTIHVRLGKMREAGIILGTKQELNYRALGYDVSAIIGIRVAGAHGIDAISEKLREIPEIVEIYYTTGGYSLVAKVMARGMEDLHQLLASTLREHEAIGSTETFVILSTELGREPPV